MRAACFAIVALLCSCAPQGGAWGGGGGRRMSKTEIDAIPSSFPVRVIPPRSPRYARQYKRISQNNPVDAAGRLVSVLINLTAYEISVEVTECGEVNATYSPRTRTIRICYELMENFEGNLRDSKNLETDLRMAVLYVTLHEIGHAMQDLLASERVDAKTNEDLADLFAFLIVTNTGSPELSWSAINSPVMWLARHDARSKHDEADEHRRGEIRARLGLCIIYGRMRDQRAAARVPDPQACDELTVQAMKHWNDLLRPYTRLETGNTFFNN